MTTHAHHPLCIGHDTRQGNPIGAPDFCARYGVLRLNRAGLIPIGEIDRAVASGI